MGARTDLVDPGRSGRLSGQPTANDRFKSGDRVRYLAAAVVTLVVHLLIFLMDPSMVTTQAYPDVAPARMEAVLLLPSIPDVPASPVQPDAIVAPAAPILPTIAFPAGVEVESQLLGTELPPPFELPEPPALPESAEAELAGFEHFVPGMVKPELVNRSEVRRALERRYPASLRNRGIEGVVVALFWIDEEGEVQKFEIQHSSGYDALDRAVVEVIEIMEFRPAMRAGRPVAVIVALPIRFELD